MEPNNPPTPVGGETQVPPEIWNTPTFQKWLASQKAAGNRLDGFSPYLKFCVGPNKDIVLYWGAQVDIWVEEEQRHKDNELVISRPDIMHVVAYHRPNPDASGIDALLDTEIVLVREFRSTASTADGFIREVPGGSGQKQDQPEVHAAKEFEEETHIKIDTNRLRSLGARQVAGTTTTHHAFVYAIELTADELSIAKAKQGKAAGLHADTEITVPDVRRLRDLLKEPLTDWGNIGMIVTALLGE